MKVQRDTLARYAALRLHAPAEATSLQQGDRRSPFLGRGLEFADYRAYDPGDDIRLIDWNVYLRLGIPLVRQFNEERSLATAVCVDVSASMDAGRPRKADHAAALAAALAVVALAHRDPVTLICFGHDRPPVQARAVNIDGLGQLLEVLQGIEPRGRGDVHAQLAAHLGRRRVDRLFLLSDLMFEDAERESLLRMLAGSSRHPVVLHVLDREDLEPDFDDLGAVVDAETGEALELVDPRQAAERYAQALARWRADLEQRCRTLGIQVIAAPTSVEVPDLVHGALLRGRVVEQAAGGHQ